MRTATLKSVPNVVRNMETAHCTNCGEDVRQVRRPHGPKSQIIKQACDCNETSHDAMPYEVDGWEWISYDG